MYGAPDAFPPQGGGMQQPYGNFPAAPAGLGYPE